MEPWQQRVHFEAAELEKRLDALCEFIATDAFDLVDKAEQDRLHRQFDAMRDYYKVLHERIAAFTEACV